jgi:DNA mismatch repair protein MutL
MPIHILPPEVASQIAAGEVVERPASVVKELIENALDAGAARIHVTIAEAGRRLIEVADDGSGIPADEIPLAVERHATSKLANADDLFRIATLGFRGEALASIGSVSRLTITSRTAASPAGARLRVEGGRARALEPVGAPVGTVIRVEDLFYNVPARLKFLKTDTTERRAIDTLLTRYALAYPRIRFRLAEGSNTALHTSGDGDRRAILATLYGVETAKQLLEVEAVEDGVRMTGFISPTSLTRSNRRDITFFINGRWIQDTALSAAVTQAYHTLLMVGRYPLTALFLDLEPASVDVNVHPAKAEVRFREPDRMFSFVQRAVRRALLAYAPVPQVAPTLWGTRREETGEVDPAWELAHNGSVDSGQWVVGSQVSAANHPLPTDNSLLSTDNHQLPTLARMPLLRLVGQIGATYIVAEGPDGLYLIDQHAAHERVLFEKLLAQHEKKNIPSQSLLTPVTVTLPPAQATLLGGQVEFLQHLGFEVEPFGPNTFQVRSMPALFAGSDPSAARRAV